MMRLFRALASIRLTLAGMALLGLGAAWNYGNPISTPVWALMVPMVLLAVNLLAAIATNSRINRNPGLLLFHIGLLAIVILAAIGQLTRFEAHVEMREQAAFSVSDLRDVKQGWLHRGRLSQVTFVQGPYTVQYAPGMVRGLTHSHVRVPDGRGGWDERVFGDDRPLVLEGYRFYTSFNKGFAPIMTWIPDRGVAVTGAVHMPSYPLFDYKQDNSWTPPGGKEIRFWLRLDAGLREDAAWVLSSQKASGILVVNTGAKRVELQPGESAALPGGVLRYEYLSGWMGYKIFYDPTLLWMLISGVLGVVGLFSYYWRKFAIPGGVKSRERVAIDNGLTHQAPSSLVGRGDRVGVEA